MAATADFPALLLPVRLEARFEPDGDEGPELWLRVYVDTVAVDTHEPEVTEQEIADTRAFWEATRAAADAEARRRAWQQLVAARGATRAAYLAQLDALAPTNPAGGGAAPQFDDVPEELRREHSWSRAPLAAALPEAWTVVLERAGRKPLVVSGSPIAAGLAVGPDPRQQAPHADPDTPALDEGMRWLVDFDAAVEAGMALRIRITQTDLTDGFDRVTVHGIRATDGAGAGRTELNALLDAHRFTDGFALVPQGAPTNNTEGGPAAWTPEDPGAARSFRVEREGVAPLRDGGLLRDVLGLDEDLLGHAEHADADGVRGAREMGTALWPATLGYFLEQLFSEVVDAGGEDRARAFFLEHVRARGPLPAVRTGTTPYGILPVTSLRLLAGSDRRPAEREVADLVRRLTPIWRQSAERVPRVTRGGNSEAVLVGLLGMDASSRAFRARPAFGDLFLTLLLGLLGLGPSYALGPLDAARRFLERVGRGAWHPRVARLALARDEFPVTLPNVDVDPVSETDGLPPVTLAGGAQGTYLTWLARAPLAEIRDDARFFPGGAPPATLLYRLARHAVLREHGRIALTSLVDAGVFHPYALRDAELVAFPSSQDKAPSAGRRAGPLSHGGAAAGAGGAIRLATVWEALDHVVPEQAAPITFAEHLRSAPHPRLEELRNALEWLAERPTAELERLMAETLDCASHRLDAWSTALATATAARRRAAHGADVHLGGFGWLEDLRSRPRPARAPREVVAAIDEPLKGQRAHRAAKPKPRVREPRGDSAGFIHAPSLPQAATAAVLRNGAITHRGRPDGSHLAVDLSSDRVRRALEVLDGVREGQSLATLLGFRVERGLHDREQDVLVQPLRDRFPLAAVELTPTGPGDAPAAVAAPNVVHGRRLHDAYVGGDLDLAIAPAGAARAALKAVLDELVDVVDAIADVGLAESVHQIVKGNPVRAGNPLDALAGGDRPPEPEVVATPRTGTAVTHRIALLFTPGPARNAVWPGAAHPRALAEPRLDAWASVLLPDPATVRCRVTWSDQGAAGGTDVTLKDLALGPLDVLALAPRDDSPAASELEERILAHAAGAVPGTATDVAIVFARGAGWAAGELTFPELLVGARAALELLERARPLRPEDLALPHTTTAAAAADGTDIDELEGRVTDARTALDAAAAALTDAATAEAALRTALATASLFGVPAAVAAPALPPAALRELAQRVGKEARGRVDRADAVTVPGGAGVQRRRDAAVDRLQALFGEAFVVLSLFTPPDAAELHAALGDSATLLDGDPDAVERWLDGLALVRAPVGAWEAATTTATLCGGSAPGTPVVAQLPRVANARWVGRRLDGSPPGGVLSLAVCALPGTDATEPHSGLLIDEWVELIPATEETTGVAFHYDQPGARAPQAWLLAVHPQDDGEWDDDALHAVVAEARDAARTRAVDLAALTDGGQLLPALYLPFNESGGTLSFDWMEL